MASTVQCAYCGARLTTPDNTWDEVPGWGCLYGTLAICSAACADGFARACGHAGVKDEDVSWSGEPNQFSQKNKEA